jgi:hypothetical protein
MSELENNFASTLTIIVQTASGSSVVFNFSIFRS